MRCGRDEVDLSGRIYIGPFIKIFDPLEANDFWLYDSESKPGTCRMSPPIAAPFECELK